MPQLPGIMLGLARVAALVVLFLLTLSLVIAIARPETGPFEKVVLVGAVVGLIGMAQLAHQVGRTPS